MSIRQLASKRRVENSPQFDQFYDQVSVLTNFDNGIRDAKNVSWLNVGAARTTSENSRFGSGSLILNNTANSWVSSPTNSAFNLNGDFTVEMWIRPGALTGGFQFILATGPDASPGQGGLGLVLGNNTYQLIAIDYTISSPAAIISSSSNVVANQWQHIALTRAGGTMRMFIGGALVGTATNNNNFNAVNVGLGAAAAGIQGVGSRRFNGMIDGLRITQTVARYTAAFTPPSAPFAEEFRSPTAPAYSAWSPSDRSANAVLSDSNRVTSSNGSGAVTKWTRSSAGRSSGKWRVQFVLEPFSGGNGTHAIGFATAGSIGTFLGETAGAWAYWGDYSGSGRLFNNNAFTQYNTFGMVNGDRFDVLLDLDAGRAWFRRNGTVISGDPVAGTGAMATFTPGTTIFLASDNFATTGGTRLRTNPTEMVDSPVAGFTDGWPDVAPNIDQFYDNVAVLNNFDGVNGATTFPNEKYRVHDRFWSSEGSAQLQTSAPAPVSGTASLSLSANNSRLFTQRSENLSFGSGDFTVEMWVRPTDATGDECLFDCRHDSQTGFAIYSSVSGAGGNAWGYTTNTGFAAYGNQLSTTAWTHIAVVRDNGAVRGYENGVLRFSIADTRTLSSAPRYVIGQASNLSDWYAGRIDSLRITRGVARYAGGSIGATIFTPATSFPARGNQTDSAQEFVTCDLDFGALSGVVSDRSAARQVWQLLGNSFVSNGEFFTNGASGGLAVTTIEPSLYDLPGDFTIEFVVKPNGLQSVAGQAAVMLQLSGDAPGTGSINLSTPVNSLDMTVFNYPTTTQLIQSTAAMHLGHDNHVALTRRGSTLRLFMNGIESGSATTSTSWTANTQVRFLSNSPNANQSFNGSAKSLKITRGFSRYTSNFRPPLRQIDPFIDNVTSLIHGQGNNLATRIHDRNARVWTAVGNASIRSANSLFGISSLYFDGSGDSITTPANEDAFSFPGDFTIEFWIRPDLATYATTKTLWDNSLNSVGSPRGIGIGLQTNNRPYLYNYQGGVFVIQSPTALVQNKWTHFAVSRSGTTTRMFMDGVLVGSSTSLTNVITNNSTVNVGGHSTAGAQFSFSGNMAEIRVTKGVGRYVENFPVPTGMFPDV